MRFHFIWSSLRISCCKKLFSFLVQVMMWHLFSGSAVAEDLCLGPMVGGASPGVYSQLRYLYWRTNMLLLAGRLQTRSQAFFRGPVYYFSISLFCLNSMEGLIVVTKL